MAQTVFVFGNPDLHMDSLPIKIIPVLSKEFPNLSFSVKDPNEDWNIPKELVILDTVVGISRIMVFEGLKQFSASANVSVHDFDAYANLRFLEKLGKLNHVIIIGVPVGISEEDATKGVIQELTRIDSLK